MKKFSTIIVTLLALSACHNDGGPSHFSRPQSPNAGIGVPSNPDYPFNNKEAQYNANITYQ